MCQLCKAVRNKLALYTPTLITETRDIYDSDTFKKIVLRPGKIDNNEDDWILTHNNNEVSITFFGRIGSTEQLSGYGNWEPEGSKKRTAKTFDDQNEQESSYSNKRNIPSYETPKADNARFRGRIYPIKGDDAWSNVLKFCQKLDQKFKREVTKIKKMDIKQNLIVPSTEYEFSAINLSWYLFSKAQTTDSTNDERFDSKLKVITEKNDPKNYIKNELKKKKLEFNGFLDIRYYVNAPENLDQKRLNPKDLCENDHVLIHCSIHPYGNEFKQYTFGFIIKPRIIVRVHPIQQLRSPSSHRIKVGIPQSLDTLKSNSDDSDESEGEKRYKKLMNSVEKNSEYLNPSGTKRNLNEIYSFNEEYQNQSNKKGDYNEDEEAIEEYGASPIVNLTEKINDLDESESDKMETS